MLALYHYFGYDLPAKERFSLIKAAGFEAVGLFRDYWNGRTDFREYADLARAVGVEVIDGHAPFIREYDIVNSLWLDNQDGETTYETYLRTINECAEDGVKNLILHVMDDFGGKYAPPPNKLGLDRIKRLVDAASKHNVTIALENITRHETYLPYIFERIDSPNLGFCYDAGHRNCNEPDVNFLSLYGDKLVAVHLHDNNGLGDPDPHLVPFEGNINWQEEMAQIAATGYTGPTTLECTTGSQGSAEAAGSRTAEEWLHDTFLAAKRLDAMRMSEE